MLLTGSYVDIFMKLAEAHSKGLKLKQLAHELGKITGLQRSFISNLQPLS